MAQFDKTIRIRGSITSAYLGIGFVLAAVLGLWIALGDPNPFETAVYSIFFGVFGILLLVRGLFPIIVFDANGVSASLGWHVPGVSRSCPQIGWGDVQSVMVYRFGWTTYFAIRGRWLRNGQPIENELFGIWALWTLGASKLQLLSIVEQHLPNYSDYAHSRPEPDDIFEWRRSGPSRT